MAARRTFGKTWWGREWVKALEEGEFAESGRLSRGRTYARQGRLTELEVEPGLLTATSWGAETYRTSLSIRTFSDQIWDQLAQLIAAKASHSASLLSGELPAPLCADAAAIGIELLPRPGDLGPDCACPDWGDPCKHSAALCYMTAELIDSDPFVLLLLRGMDRASVLRGVRAHRSGASAAESAPPAASGEPRAPDPGMSAEEAFARWNSASTADSNVIDLNTGLAVEQQMLPMDPRALPQRVGRSVRLTAQPPADSGMVLGELEDLVSDTSRRALALLRGNGSAALALTVEEDLVRRAAGAVRRRETIAPLAEKAGVDESRLAAWAAAWQVGGQMGLTAHLSPTAMTPEQEAAARSVLGPRTRSSGGGLQQGKRQLRLGPHGTWWRFVTHLSLGWILEAGPFTGPEEAV